MKSALLALAFLATQFAAFGRTSLDLGFPASGTPYDPYMAPVRQVLTHLGTEQTSMDRVRHLMHEGREFRYSFTSPYVAAPPQVTEATHAGDCKAKALWLADEMGDGTVRFVIGKARSSSQMSHAWLMWEHDNRWWILDCTNNWDPIPADRVSSSQYIPFYSFSKSGEFRHRSTVIYMAATSTASSNSGEIAQR